MDYKAIRHKTGEIKSIHLSSLNYTTTETTKSKAEGQCEFVVVDKSQKPEIKLFRASFNSINFREGQVVRDENLSLIFLTC